MTGLENIGRVYFIGIGGIGMSALARYFIKMGVDVAGYDSTPTPLTNLLEKEGASIHYTDDISKIPNNFKSGSNATLVVYTPAVSENHKELQFFRNNGFEVVKRAQALGVITKNRITAAVAGTHGKTTTSTMLAHLLCQNPAGCDAFLGGISKNYANNLLLSDRGSNIIVVEADEFDRSFLSLNPNIAIITSIDADHLDIFGTYDEVKKAFIQFVGRIKPNGVAIVKKGLEWVTAGRPDIKTYTYSVTEEADYMAIDMSLYRGFNVFNLKTPNGTIDEITLGVMGRYNTENAVAAAAAAIALGTKPENILGGLESFKGVSRRFDLRFSGKKSIYIDDYAHHPEELRAAIESTRQMFPERKITGVFQPHLYTRTRDFADDFAKSLSLLDELIITDIYPAREEPIEGITHDTILSKVTCPVKLYCNTHSVIEHIRSSNIDILLTMGAGSIDKLAEGIVVALKEKE